MCDNENNEFDEEIDYDEETTLDFIIEMLGALIEKDRRGVHIADPVQYKNFAESYKILKDKEALCGYKTTYEINEPYIGTGAISLNAKKIVFNSPKVFIDAGRKASNFDIYPKTDGTVQVDFAFNSLTNKVKEDVWPEKTVPNFPKSSEMLQK